MAILEKVFLSNQVAILLAALIVGGSIIEARFKNHDRTTIDGRGNYEVVPAYSLANADVDAFYAWRIDTRTGDLTMCEYFKNFHDETGKQTSLMCARTDELEGPFGNAYMLGTNK